MKSNKVVTTNFFIYGFLYLIIVSVRCYGIWFGHWAFDEEQHFEGGLFFLKYLLNFFGDYPQNHSTADLIYTYGILGKYLSVIPVAFGFAIERLFSINYPIPLALVFTRIGVSLLPSILTVYLCHKIAKLVDNKHMLSYLVLLLFCFTFKHIETAHYAVADSLSTFLATWTIYYLMKWQKQPDKIFPYLTKIALLVCLTASTKLNVGLIIGLLSGIGILWIFIQEKLPLKKLMPAYFYALFIFLLSFGLVNLPYLLQLNNWIHTIQHLILTYPYIMMGRFDTLFYAFPAFGVGLPIVFLAFVGIGISMYQRKKLWFFPSLFLGLFYIYLSISKGMIHRWAIPMTPFFVLLAAYSLQTVYKYLAKKVTTTKIATFTLAGCIGIIAYLPFREILFYNYSLVAQPNSYEQVVAYVKDTLANQPLVGSVIGLHIPNLNREAPSSIADLGESKVQYAVFSDFWFWERLYPRHLLNMETINTRRAGDWGKIRKHIEENWTLKKTIAPAYYSAWSTNVASPPVFYIYEK